MTVRGQETIRIEAATRWDALDLVRRLTGFRTHLVQMSDRRWLVCVRPDGDPNELAEGVRTQAERWVSERRIDSTMQFGDRSYVLRP